MTATLKPPRQQAACDLRDVFLLACQTVDRTDDEQAAVVRIAAALDASVAAGEVDAITSLVDGGNVTYARIAIESWEPDDYEYVDADLPVVGPTHPYADSVVISPLLCDTERGSVKRWLDRRAELEADG